MNTKTFAQTARRILMDGVAQKLLYWGFSPKGDVLEEPLSVSGGYSFRGEVFDDATLPTLWKKLRTAIRKKGMEVIVEEAAYTWFNRIMALRIMAKNDYEEAQLSYVEGMEHTPIILQRARQGEYSFLNATEQERLRNSIGDYNKDAETFALLLVGYCHNHQMLNNVFGKLDDYTELLLPDNMLQENGFLHLLNTTDAISDEDYKKVELIGWLYQFYISERKDEVFASFKKNKKAEAKDIPAATQIFTPNWIVKYMVENTAGKIWLDKNPDSPLKENMKYLVENDNDGQSEELINDVEELTLIDPACGSGHILVEGFDLLYKMYMEEYYTPEEAVQTILEKNLFGLDIDDRAAQLATFAILLKAAQQYRDVFSKGWMPQVYTMPEAQDFSEQEVKDFLGDEGEDYWEELYKALLLMKQAKNLGSVMKLSLSEDARSYIETRFADLKTNPSRDFNVIAVFNSLRGYIPVLLILTKKYSSVVANPPYMGQKSMNGELKVYVNKHYPMTKSDLMTVFMEVIPNMTEVNSRFALINLPSWLFLSSFEKMREFYLKNYAFDSLLHMGRGIFGIDFGSVAFAVRKSKEENPVGSYFRLHERNFQHIYYEDIGKLFLYSNGNTNYQYDFGLYRGEDGITKIPEKGNEKGLKLFYPNISQTNFSKIPGSPIAYWVRKSIVDSFSMKKLGSISYSSPGVRTGKDAIFIKFWHEVSILNINNNAKIYSDIKPKSHLWFPITRGGGFRKWYGLFDHVILIGSEASKIRKECHDHRLREPNYYFKNGITWTMISSTAPSFRFVDNGILFGNGGPVVFTDNDICFTALLNSVVTSSYLKLLNPTLNYTKSDVEKIPIVKIPAIEGMAKKSIDLSKNDWDSHETSLGFEKSPMLNETDTLITAYNAWQEKVTHEFFQLHANEEELNRIFIDIYGLQDELTPDVALKDITILQDELDRKALEALEPTYREQGKDAIELPIDKGEVIRQFISYCISVFMGRYRLDKEGLNIAHPNPTADELESYTYKHGEVEIDEDAILPLMGNNCNFPDDAVLRINELLDTIWGHEVRTENINFIQECLYPNAANKDLNTFLVKDFYKYHCKMYKKKPIYWLFSSKKGAFQVLVYMHRMNEFTAEKIRANYLLEHIKQLRGEQALLQSNESSLNTQEARRLEQLSKDIPECEAYDMELKNIADQQIKIDLDDGVTANYKLFERVVAKIK